MTTGFIIFLAIWGAIWLLTCVGCYFAGKARCRTRREFIVMCAISLLCWPVTVVVGFVESDWLDKPIGIKK